MSEDERPEIPEQPEATGAPAPEQADEGLTPEERAMLESLSPGAPEAAPPAEETPEKPAEDADLALSPEEEAMLAELAGEGAAGEPTVAEVTSASETTPPAESPAPPPAPSGAAPPPAPPADFAAELTPEEQQVREQVLSESERVSREEVPAMFEEKPAGAAGEAEAPAEAVEPEQPLVAEVIDEEEIEAPAVHAEGPAAPTAPKPPGRIARLLAAPFDLINLPFRWLPPVWRVGLGLCGVLLLITLLLVILVRMLFES